MNTFECYREYHALKAHFTSTYDYMKYQGKMKSCTPIALERNKQRYMFEKLAKMKDPRGYIIANLLQGKIWVGDMLSSEGDQIYKAYRKRIDSLDYSLMEEVKKHLGDNPDETLTAVNGYPKLFRSYIKGDVSIELIIALDKAMKRLVFHWDKHMNGDPLWEETYNKIVKYNPFFIQNDLKPFIKELRKYYAERAQEVA